MKGAYLAAFVGGLLLAVRIMIRGVEQPAATHRSGERSFRLSPAVQASFGIVFGLVGYLLDTRLSGAAIFWSSAALACLAAFATARLVTKWWTVVPEHDVDDERYVL